MTNVALSGTGAPSDSAAIRSDRPPVNWKGGSCRNFNAQGGCINTANGLIASGVSFSDNRSPDHGGCAWVASGKFTNCSFSNCAAATDGGAVYVDPSSESDVSFGGSTFSRNSAQGFGGDVYFQPRYEIRSDRERERD